MKFALLLSTLILAFPNISQATEAKEACDQLIMQTYEEAQNRVLSQFQIESKRTSAMDTNEADRVWNRINEDITLLIDQNQTEFVIKKCSQYGYKNLYQGVGSFILILEQVTQDNWDQQLLGAAVIKQHPKIEKEMEKI